MYFDIVDGKRSDVTPALLPAEPSPRMLRILREGPELRFSLMAGQPLLWMALWLPILNIQWP